MSKKAEAGLPGLAVNWLPIEVLNANPKNPRRHTDKRVAQIAASIEALGFNVPILVDAARNIVAGHGRFRAANKLGWSQVPTIDGSALIQSLRSESRLNIIQWKPRLDKVTRAHQQSVVFEGGRVLLPERAPWLGEFEHELLAFPNGRNDDQVDSAVQFLD